MTEKEVLLEDVTTGKEVHHEDEMIAKDLHPDADHHHQQALLDHFDLFMPISNMVKVEVHRELEVDHLIDIHLVPRDHTRSLQVPAEDQNHPTENDLEKPKTMDSSVTVQFHHPVICIR